MVVSPLDSKHPLTLDFLVGDLVSSLHDAPTKSSAGSLHQFEVVFWAPRRVNISNRGIILLLIENLIYIVPAKINLLATYSH